MSDPTDESALVAQGLELEATRRALEEAREELAAARRALAESAARESRLASEASLFRGALDAITDGINIRDTKYSNIYANPVALGWMGIETIEQIDSAEHNWRYYHVDEVTPYKPEEVPTRKVVEGEEAASCVALHVDETRGVHRWLRSTASAVRNPDGTLRAVVNLVRDISEARENVHALAERTIELRERERERAELIERLEGLVRELSSPALEVADGVLVVPVIGAVDEARGIDLLEGTLEAVQRRAARVVIVELTGARIESPSSAHQLTRLVHALDLLGARCVLAGIRPALARFLVENDLAPEDVDVYSSLKHALHGALEG